MPYLARPPSEKFKKTSGGGKFFWLTLYVLLLAYQRLSSVHIVQKLLQYTNYTLDAYIM